jgi:hypothetical protein
MVKVNLDPRNQPFDKNNVSNALYFIPADIERGTWLKIAQALKSSGEPFETSDEWSRDLSSYKSSDCQSVWKSISPDVGIGAGTLFYIAKQHGYKPGDKRTSQILLDTFNSYNVTSNRGVPEQRKTLYPRV